MPRVYMHICARVCMFMHTHPSANSVHFPPTPCAQLFAGGLIISLSGTSGFSASAFASVGNMDSAPNAQAPIAWRRETAGGDATMLGDRVHWNAAAESPSTPSSAAIATARIPNWFVVETQR